MSISTPKKRKKKPFLERVGSMRLQDKMPKVPVLKSSSRKTTGGYDANTQEWGEFDDTQTAAPSDASKTTPAPKAVKVTTTPAPLRNPFRSKKDPAELGHGKLRLSRALDGENNNRDTFANARDLAFVLAFLASAGGLLAHLVDKSGHMATFILCVWPVAAAAVVWFAKLFFLHQSIKHAPPQFQEHHTLDASGQPVLDEYGQRQVIVTAVAPDHSAALGGLKGSGLSKKIFFGGYFLSFCVGLCYVLGHSVLPQHLEPLVYRTVLIHIPETLTATQVGKPLLFSLAALCALFVAASFLRSREQLSTKLSRGPWALELLLVAVASAFVVLQLASLYSALLVVAVLPVIYLIIEIRNILSHTRREPAGYIEAVTQAATRPPETAHRPAAAPAGPSATDDTGQGQFVHQQQEQEQDDPDMAPIIEPRPLEEVLADIDKQIGLTDFKRKIRDDITYLRAEQIKKDYNPEYKGKDQKLSTIFSGPPGTGKTLVAGLIAEVYAAMGLSNGRFTKTTSSKLIGSPNIGTGRQKMEALIDANRGGVIFLDEFGELVNGAHSAGNVGHEIIAPLLNAIENEPDCPITIIADYEKRIDEALAMNDGMASRFRNRFLFPSYTPEELLEIAKLHVGEDWHDLSPAAEEELKTALTTLYDDYSTHPAWSSARVATTLYSKAKEAQSAVVEARMTADPAHNPFTIEAEDITRGLESYMAAKPFPARTTR
jgi:DNA polymerase III delta prime subunit